MNLFARWGWQDSKNARFSSHSRLDISRIYKLKNSIQSILKIWQLFEDTVKKAYLSRDHRLEKAGQKNTFI